MTETNGLANVYNQLLKTKTPFPSLEKLFQRVTLGQFNTKTGPTPYKCCAIKKLKNLNTKNIKRLKDER